MVQTILLGDIAKIKGGKRLPKGEILQSQSNDHPYLRIVDMGQKNILRSNLMYVPNEVFTKIARYITNTNDVLLSIVGTIGLVSIVDESLNKASLTENCVKIICDEVKIKPEFLYYFLSSSLGKSEVAAGRVGSTQPKLPLYNIAKIKIPELSIREQNRIADILGNLDEKIELNRKMNETLEQMGQALFRHYFIANPEAEKWKSGKLEDLFEVTMGQSPPGSSYNSSGDGITFYQGRGEFGVRFPSKRLSTVDPKRLARQGDTLLSVRAPVGDINQATEDCCVGRGIAAISSKYRHTSFTYYMCRSLQSKFSEYNSEGTVFGAINGKQLKFLKLKIPPVDEMDEFEKKGSVIDTLILNNSQEIQTLTTLRDTLLPRLISGKIKV